jgi:hypothetical protein
MIRINRKQKRNFGVTPVLIALKFILAKVPFFKSNQLSAKMTAANDWSVIND